MNSNTHALARPRPLALPLRAQLAGWLARMGAAAARRLHGGRQGTGELHAMSDGELRDLGIGRSEIAQVLRSGRG
jgi:uncharacterized protein YjiS (DUF1127 family)